MAAVRKYAAQAIAMKRAAAIASFGEIMRRTRLPIDIPALPYRARPGGCPLGATTWVVERAESKPRGLHRR